MLSKFTARVFAGSFFSLGAVLAIAPAVLAESIPFAVVRVSDSYVCRNKNTCMAVIESAAGDRYRINYADTVDLENGDRVLVDIEDRTWRLLRHPETGRTAIIIKQSAVSR